MHTDKQMGQWDRLESLGTGPLVQKHNIMSGEKLDPYHRTYIKLNLKTKT